MLHVLKHAQTHTPLLFLPLEWASVLNAGHAGSCDNQPMRWCAQSSSHCNEEAVAGCIFAQEKNTLCHNKCTEQRLLCDYPPFSLREKNGQSAVKRLQTTLLAQPPWASLPFMQGLVAEAGERDIFLSWLEKL